MRKIFSLLLLVGVFWGCAKVNLPTPFAMPNLVKANEEALLAWNACAIGPNYMPEKPGCDVVVLKQKNEKAQQVAYEFIRGDPTQPQGFDIYLEQTLIGFRINHENITSTDYIEKERIAEQFFETQKATSGRSLTNASYLFTLLVAEGAAYQYYHDRPALTIDRRATLLKAINAGAGAFHLVAPERNRRLRDSLQVLEFLVQHINSTL